MSKGNFKIGDLVLYLDIESPFYKEIGTIISVNCGIYISDLHKIKLLKFPNSKLPLFSKGEYLKKVNSLKSFI